MLGLIFIYFLGKAFYDLAVRNGEEGWGYAILGVVIYYASTFVAGVLIYLFFDLMSPGALDEANEMVVALFTIPFGLMAAYGMYKYFENRFRRKQDGITRSNDSEFLDQDYFK